MNTPTSNQPVGPFSTLGPSNPNADEMDPPLPPTANLRRLNENGIARFTGFLDSLTGDVPMPYPSALLTDPDATEEIQPTIGVEQRVFESRYAAAEYLYNVFKDSNLADIERDRGLWAWLSLLYFEQLCPLNARGQRKPGERARWIPDFSWRKYYRHPLLQPYRLYKSYSDDPSPIRFLLQKPLSVLGDFAEQVFSRQEIITNPALLGAVKNLYYDNSNGREKKRSYIIFEIQWKDTRQTRNAEASCGRFGTLRCHMGPLQRQDRRSHRHASP